jgi:hypothetical protein
MNSVRIVVGAVVAVVVAAVLGWTLSDGPPRPRLLPATTAPAATGGTATVVVATVYRPEFLPTGFKLVAERGGPADQFAGPSPEDAPVPVGDAYLLHYERPRPDNPPDSLDVLTVERPEDPDAASTSSTTPRVTDAQTSVVRVHDREALEVTTTLPGPVRILTWDESPGLQLRVVATGQITVDELHAVADSLRAE